MKSFNPIQSKEEFNRVCKANCHEFIRLIEYCTDELSEGALELSRRDFDIRKHQLAFYRELANRVERAANGSLTTGAKL